MSHVATVECRVTDLDALAAALGGKAELRRGQASFRSYQSGQKCAHAIRLTGDAQAYEIGLQRRAEAEESYDLKYDSWGPGRALEVAFCPGLVGLRNEYMATVAEWAMQRRGWSVQREQVGQEIHLYARG